jgi:hypothetical protein
MKRLISILFLIIYVNAGFGASVDYHYCAGKLVGLKVCGIALKSQCPMKSMQSGCCQDRLHLCRTDNHVSPIVAVVTPPETSFKIPVFLVDSYDLTPVTIDQPIKDYFPPGYTNRQLDCPLFISNRVFRI